MNARKILADRRVVDGAKVLAPRLYQNPAGLEALLLAEMDPELRRQRAWVLKLFEQGTSLRQAKTI